MRTRRFVYRMVYTMAVATTPWVPGMIGQASGADLDGGSEAGRIQLVQHSSNSGGQTAGASNGAVSAELKKLFEESGQPMPSMNPRDLPNAQVRQPNAIRPVQRPAGQASGTPPASSSGTKPGVPGQQQNGVASSGKTGQTRPQTPAKRGFLQRFMGKVTGQEKKAAEANVVPPVPPDFREPAPAPPSGGVAAAHPAGSSSSLQASQGVRQGTPSSSSAKTAQTPGAGHYRSPQSGAIRSASNGRVQAPQNGTSSQSGVASSAAVRVPARPALAGQGSGQVRVASQPSQPVPEIPKSVATSASQLRVAPPENVSAGTKYVQPGTAPGFMPSNQSKVMVEAKPATRAAEEEIKSEVPMSTPADSFELPFVELDSAEPSESLDLDSIANVVPEEIGASGTSGSTSESAVTVPEGAINSEFPLARSSEDTESSDNPFTGVTLTMPEEGLSQPGDGTVLPAEDFENRLPSISLPSVEDLDNADSDTVGGQPELGFPELNFEEQSESLELVPTPNQIPEESEVRRPEPTGEQRSADVEHLQQVAEQERRVRQQRMIQARTEQVGFKGFCPVELRDRRELTDTRPEYSATFGLQTYTFSSAAAKAAFEADPSRYAPAAGGSDVVLLVNSGEEQPGMLDYALWYRDRLYLFRSRETMAMFNKDPLRFANQY